jgi:succinate dehydrogenase flavin-adding protein (antitoxin of CptAB toxin-antitoxin module)
MRTSKGDWWIMPKSKTDISIEEARRIFKAILDAQDSDWWAEMNVEEVIEVELSVALLYDIQKWIDDNA